MAGTERRHLWLTGVLAALLLGIAAAVAVPLWTGAGQSASEAAPPPGPPLPPPGCPTATVDDFQHMAGSRTGALVPAGAASGVACSYAVLGESASLNGSEPLDGAAVLRVVTLLNDLPAKLEPGVEHACLAMGRDEHRVVLAYRDGRAPVVVDISSNCGTAHHDGAVRYLRNAKKLLKLIRVVR